MTAFDWAVTELVLDDNKIVDVRALHVLHNHEA
jgi:hypothetical protein